MIVYVTSSASFPRHLPLWAPIRESVRSGVRALNESLNGFQIPSVTEPQRDRWIFDSGAYQKDGRGLTPVKSRLYYLFPPKKEKGHIDKNFRI